MTRPKYAHPDPDHFYSFDDIQRMLGFSAPTVNRMLKDGEIPGAKLIAKKWRVSVRHWNAWVESWVASPTPPRSMIVKVMRQRPERQVS